MQFRAPPGVAGISVNGIEYLVDDASVITVPDNLPAEEMAEFTNAGFIVASGDTVEKANADAAEREELISKLAGYGQSIDRRRRYSLDTLREMVGVIELQRALAAKEAGGDPAQTAPQQPSGDTPPANGGAQ